MKALVYVAPEQLDYREVPEPTPADHEVLVKVSDVGICGSDIHAYLGHDERRPAPLILGHEVAGVVVGGKHNAMRVTVNPLVVCGTCSACISGRDNLCSNRQIISMPPREGAFAEALAIPYPNLVEVPDDVPLHKAALTEAIACGWHAVRIGLEATATNSPKALVIGGGAVGVGAALSLLAQGVKDPIVIETNQIRRSCITDDLAIQAISPDELDPTVMFDLIVDAVGIEPSRALASRAVMPGGVITHIGLGLSSGGLDIRRITLQEISFIGTYAYTSVDFRDTAAAIFSGQMGALDWIECRPLSAGQQAFVDIQNGKVKAPKIILQPD